MKVEFLRPARDIPKLIRYMMMNRFPSLDTKYVIAETIASQLSAILSFFLKTTSLLKIVQMVAFL